jgi:AraC family transcriptional regulator
MSVSIKAIWAIERHLDQPLSLDSVARACGTSKFHLAHAFGAATGRAVIHYVRGRRLSRAAERLAAGHADILGLAIETGYGSHEAFSRAFRAQFGMTPEEVRCRQHVEGLAMTEPMKLPGAGEARLEEPRLVQGGPLIVVGLSERRSFDSQTGIPEQWQRFMTRYGDIADKADPAPLGVITPADDEGHFNYLCGVEVSRVSEVPAGLTVQRVAAGRYAVFLHRGHVATIGATYSAIFDDWLPRHHKTLGGGATLERHLPSFDPRTGLGGVEIWVSIVEAD